MIDCHCHLVPPWLRAPGSAAWKDPWFASCHEGKSPRFAAGADVIGAIDEAGITTAVVFGWPFADSGLLRECNDYVAAEATNSAGRLIGFATVNPGHQEARRELQRGRDLGLLGLGELNCDAQGFGLAWEGGLRATLKSCDEMGWPVLLHASEPVGHLYPGKGLATPGRVWKMMEPLQREAPELRLCLAHLGGGLAFYVHMPEVRRVCERLWFDSAALPFLYDRGILAQLAQLLGEGRICFGSDFPLLGPGRYGPQLEVLTEAERRSFMEDAARSWLGTPKPQLESEPKG